jgi:hypothetical protein
MNDNRMVSGRQLPSVEAVLAEMKRRDTPFDAVGIQSHMRNEGRVPLDTVQANLDRLAAYGRLHITELSVPARPLAAGETVFDAVAWDGWSEQTQAAYTVGLVRLAFGHSSVDAVAYWAMTDRRDDPPTIGAGLLRADLCPRPVYEALHALIREARWTRWDGQTDRAGRAPVPMFYGEHNVIVSRPGGTPLAMVVSVTRPDQVITITLR